MRWFLLAGLLLTVACAESSSADLDSGATLPDAHTTPDAGDTPDAALPDAALPDAGPRDSGQPSLGMLQLHVQHDLATDDCLARRDCALTLETPTASLDAWLDDLAAVTSQATMHYDRAIPWDVFALVPPPSEDPVAFYDARIDRDLAAYLASFQRVFARADDRYVAVSILGGVRDRIAALRKPDGSEVTATGACTPFTATATITFEPGEDPVPIEAAYRRFVSYLAAKLHPTRLALLVEANLYRKTCPDRWADLAALYHRLYDGMRAELGGGVELFATLTWADLLGFDADRCFTLRFSPCSGSTPPPAPQALDAATCYPLDLGAITDLDAGDRLDVLALSFYPDGLSMDPPGVPSGELAAFEPMDEPSTSTCSVHAALPALLDPFEPLDRLGWTKPIAMAEWAARSCPTYQWWQSSTQTFAIRITSSPERQVYWLDRFAALSRSGRFEFANYSFYADYAPIGLWMPRRGALDPTIFNLLNFWPCSGLYDADLRPKPGVREHWPL